MNISKQQKRKRLHNRIRSRVSGTAKKPRLSISKSNRNIIGQIIDDEKNVTLAYAWSKNTEGKNMKERVISAGTKIAEDAKAKKITKVVFDRGGFNYTGHVASFADAARKGGLKF